jgi:hypothetical protein
MTALSAPPFAVAPQTLPWYRVVPPFAWFTRPAQPKRLRPAGHSAWVEAMHQPVLFAISLAFTSAGLYTLAKDYVVRAFAAIGAGDYGQIIPVCLALFVIVITGAAIEIAFLTAASRLRMHLLRKEWGWTAVSGIMLLLTVGVEGLTCSYMFYLIEAPKLSLAWQQFMGNIPTLLFFVRAFAGLVCAAYLIIGVLPFVIRPEDVRREMAAEAGAAKVAIIQRLLHVINDLNVWQMLAIYEPVAAIFRDNAGYTSNQMAHRLVLDALDEVKTELVATLSAQGMAPAQLAPTLAGVFEPVERAFHERGTGAELERYDAQTHAALTRLQERLQQVATTPTDPPPAAELDQRLDAFAAQMTRHLNARLAEMQAHLSSTGGATPLTDDDDREPSPSLAPRGAPRLATSTAAAAQTSAKAPPKVGTRRFNEVVYAIAQRLWSEDRLSIFNIAHSLQVDAHAVQAALLALKQERIRHLKPGKELEPDPVLDSL